MISSVLFDLDNTLLDFSLSERTALSDALMSFGISPSDDMLGRYSIINDRHWKSLEQGRISRDEVLLHRFTEFLAEFSLDVPDRDMKAAYEERLTRQYFVMPGALDMLKRLYGRYRLYIISNGTPSVQYGRLEGSGLGRFFDGILISQELGFEKPDSRFFDAALSRVPDLLKEESVIIGDSLTSDIQGGINAGIRTIWFDPALKPLGTSTVPDYVLYGWDGLDKLLAGI